MIEKPDVELVITQTERRVCLAALQLYDKELERVGKKMLELGLDSSDAIAKTQVLNGDGALVAGLLKTFARLAPDGQGHLSVSR